MTVTAPPRPPRPSDPVDRDELEALVEALIEEARRRARRRRLTYAAAIALVALVGVAIFAVFDRTAQSQNASRSPTLQPALVAGRQLAITVTGRGVAGDSAGTFTILGAVSDSGTSHVGGNTSTARPLLGRRVYRGRAQGPGEFRGKKGTLSLWWKGSFVSVNVSTVITTGTWRVRSGTGIYKTWKGGGSFVSVDHHAPSPDNRTPSGVGSYEARFDGRVTR